MFFTVYAKNNPVPYKRTTQRQKFKDDGYKRYLNWKDDVRSAFIKEFRKYPQQLLDNNIKYHMDIVIYFKDRRHGDSDNVFKGIADALFAKPLSDKYLAGSFDFEYDSKNPRVEVSIREANVSN